jgi:hypothetical protein
LREERFEHIRAFDPPVGAIKAGKKISWYGENIIATVLGHTDTKVTKKYVRYASDSIKPFFERKKARKGTVHKLSPRKGESQ